MKAAVLTTVLLFATCVKSQISDPKCVVLYKSVPVTFEQCSGYVTVGSCSGGCSSTVSYSPYSFLKVTRSCLCCTETKMVAMKAKLPCKPEGFHIHKYYTIAGCACIKCGALSFDVSELPPVETAAALEDVGVSDPKLAA
ncbi:uncharacterized protein LOC144790630 [Lissotriton helveticus]